ncbi:flavoprotein [Neobacillus mesonae]|uniref:flavoprotein n=1 Tax=Neobacillus mesonae TaxID=1193713 RepID=UPI000831C745|nr:flavoprotein [Neobacillus mesonae]MED4205716.1 flavoprotein [Neobacillus mesonae]
MEADFRQFLDQFLEIWRNSSLPGMEKIISEDYQAREIADGKIIDFGYNESISGWKQGFNFVLENRAQWDLRELAILPINKHETMAIIFASLIINGKKTETGNLFFETFKTEDQKTWKLVRSYIEAGVTSALLDK